MTLVQLQLTDDDAKWPATIWGHVWCDVEESPLMHGPSGGTRHEYNVEIESIEVALTVTIDGGVYDAWVDTEAKRDRLRNRVLAKINADRKWFDDLAIEAFQRGN